MNLRPYVDIAKLVWPLALGMLNNAVLQFVDGVFLAEPISNALGGTAAFLTMLKTVYRRERTGM